MRERRCNGDFCARFFILMVFIFVGEWPKITEKRVIKLYSQPHSLHHHIIWHQSILNTLCHSPFVIHMTNDKIIPIGVCSSDDCHIIDREVSEQYIIIWVEIQLGHVGYLLLHLMGQNILFVSLSHCIYEPCGKCFCCNKCTPCFYFLKGWWWVNGNDVGFKYVSGC